MAAMLPSAKVTEDVLGLAPAPGRMGLQAAPAEDVDDFLRDVELFEQHRDFAALARGLATHAKDAEAASTACRSLAKVCRYDNREEVAKLAVMHVATVMDLHAENGKVQAAACAALAMMALNSQEGKGLMEKSGALERLVTAMERHVQDRQVQGMSCYAMMSVTNPATRASIVAAGGIPRCIEAAAAHPSDYYVQDAAWWAIYGLVKDMSMEEKSASLGASVELVIDLLKRAMKDPDATDKTREFGQILLDTLQDGVAQRAEEAPRSVRVAKKEVFAVPAFTAAVDA